VKAYVVAVPGRILDFVALRAWAGERLSAFKVPRFWETVDALPRTPTSRVAKHQLSRERTPDEYDAEA
jgi:acyl-CoA synthetase (AMP-forming)/AMP-acid ligase II